MFSGFARSHLPISRGSSEGHDQYSAEEGVHQLASVVRGTGVLQQLPVNRRVEENNRCSDLDSGNLGTREAMMRS